MLLDDFEQVSQASTRDEFRAALIRFAEYLEFPLVALALGTDTPRGSRFVTVSNVPSGFEEAFNSIPNQQKDPVMQSVKIMHRPVVWDQQTYVSAGAMDIWDTQAAFGYKAGIAVALHLPQGKHVVLGIDRDKPLPKRDAKLTRLVADLHLLAVHAQDAALRLLEPTDTPNLPRLTARELEILHWVLLGKSTSVIAEIVSLTADGVNFHLRNIFRKLDCSSRHTAVIKAVQLGLLTTTD